MNVTLGGDRLGSGNKNKLALRNYERSTHNLSQKWTSSMQVGALYPFLVIPAMRGDTFEIDLNADARTIPTKGPLFGSFKVQYDVFQCPWRLYQAILHNNPQNIGLQMNQVKLPLIQISSKSDIYSPNDPAKFKSNCLLKYLGISGIGQVNRTLVPSMTAAREFNALPILAYYDIFKNYYANKQEENAYVISGGTRPTNYKAESITFANGVTRTNSQGIVPDTGYDGRGDIKYGRNIEKLNNEKILDSIIFKIIDDDGGDTSMSMKEWNKWYIANAGSYVANPYYPFQIINKKNNTVTMSLMPWRLVDLWQKLNTGKEFTSLVTFMPTLTANEEGLTIRPFNLIHLDDMRYKLLSWHNFGTPFMLTDAPVDEDGKWTTQSGNDRNGLPYSTLFTTKEDTGISYNSLYDLNGLVLKTYQSDLFNNWVRTEWIDGENGINAITAISTADGSFQLDAFNLAEKLYNMLNRVAVSDGTYEGWQDAVYTKSPRRHIESPVYLGGMSSEIVFEEIVQSAPADGDPLGTLGGKGTLVKRKGGRVVVKCDEASFIIGIVSITPRINYTQGNEWYMTDLKTMDDLHKPALDGIGFQNLLQEQMHYGGAIISGLGDGMVQRPIAGKVPAWINYMTAVDKGFGDFAETDGRGFMLLQRNYECDESGISDMTTYIDPMKYNYAFAYTDLSSQNFWVQIYSDIKARRLMSAKQIPNL